MTTHARDTPPEIGVCGHCLRYVLRCWCDGLSVTAELYAINLRGQLSALEEGLDLFQLETGIPGSRRTSYLASRDQWRIANRGPHIALPEHRCEKNWEAFCDAEANRRIGEWRRPKSRASSVPAPPPF